jgi:hypothetical protein
MGEVSLQEPHYEPSFWPGQNEGIQKCPFVHNPFLAVSRNAGFVRSYLSCRLENLPFIDTLETAEIFPALWLIWCLKTASTNQRPHIALFTEF